MDEKEFRCVSSTCILKSNQLPLATSVIIVILFAIQISTLIAVVYFAVESASTVDYDLRIIAFGSMYAVVSVTSSLYKTLFDFVRFISCIIHNKSEHRIELTMFKVLVLLLEASVIGLTVLSLLVLIPQQGDIISIVVNATGIICVSELDDQLFATFNIKYFGIPEVVERVEKADIFDWIKVILPPILMILGYFALLLVAQFWLAK
jgi:hypothetical protein